LDEAELKRVKKGLEENGYVIHTIYKEKYNEFCVLLHNPKLKIEAWGFNKNELDAYKEALNTLD